MDPKRIPHEWQTDDHSTLKLEHGKDGYVWLIVIPPRKYKMNIERKKVGGIALAIRPEMAKTIGQDFIDEALKATQQSETSSN